MSTPKWIQISTDRVQYHLGHMRGTVAWILLGLIFSYIGVLVGLTLFLCPGGAPWLLVISAACAGAMHLALLVMRRRGDDLWVSIWRDPGVVIEHAFEVRYGNRPVAKGPFSPELLRIDTVQEHRTKIGLTPTNVYRLLFLFPNPIEDLGREYREAVPLFTNDSAKVCVEHLVALLQALSIDPKDVGVAVPEGSSIPGGVPSG